MLLALLYDHYRQLYYEVVIADVDVNGKSIDVPCGVYNDERTIVDSGTTNVLVRRNGLFMSISIQISNGFQP